MLGMGRAMMRKDAEMKENELVFKKNELRTPTKHAQTCETPKIRNQPKSKKLKIERIKMADQYMTPVENRISFCCVLPIELSR